MPVWPTINWPRAFRSAAGREPGDVAAGATEVGDEAAADWIENGGEDDRNGAGPPHKQQQRISTAGENHIGSQANQFARSEPHVLSLIARSATVD